MKNCLSKRIIAVVAAAVTAMTTFAGCSSTTTKEEEPINDKKVNLGFPIVDKPITLKYFININGAMSATMPTYADVEAFKEIEKLTNIKIQWIHPTGGGEQFALMIASNDLPDIINWNFGTVKGGSETLVRDKILMPLSEKDLNTYAPNYMRIMEKNPEIKKNTMLDNGTMFQFINFNLDTATDKVVNFNIKGPYIRMDWVEKVGMKAPTTIDELHDVLKAFKDKNVNGKGNVIPFIDDKSLTATRAMAGSFGTRQNMHMKNGKIVYGPTTPEFKTYLQTMNKWYTEGIINSDFPVLADRNPKILSSEAGFTIGSMGSGLTMQRETLKKSDPNSNLDSLPYIKGPGGYQCLIDDIGANPRATAITSANKYPKETLRWLDYAYSKEGSLLTTFGIKGKSYEIINGKPTLTDLVMKSTQGYNQEEAISRYALGAINYPNARDLRFYEQVNLNTEQKKQIQTNWQTGKGDILIPPITLSAEEAPKYANFMADINTYTSEMALKFIIGKEPLDKFDDFVAKVEKMGIKDAIAIQEKALARFNARK